MIFGKTKLELKVGLFVFCGLVILMIFILSLGGFKTWTCGYRVNFTFGFINGVKIGAPVRFAGVDVGEVKKINFLPYQRDGKTTIQVVVWLRKNVLIPVDSTVWVNTLGLLGEKYIEIIPGKNYNKFLIARQSLEGVDPIPMHEVFRMAKGVVENINDGITRIKNKEGTIGKLLYDDTVYKNIEQFTDDIKKNPWKLFFKAKEVK